VRVLSEPVEKADIFSLLYLKNFKNSVWVYILEVLLSAEKYMQQEFIIIA